MRLSSTLVAVRRLAVCAVAVVALAVAAPAAVRLLAFPTPATAQGETSTDPQATRTGRGSWTTYVDGQRIAMRWTGAFRLSDDQRRIEWIEPGASVTISNGARWFPTGVEVKATEDGRLEPHYFRGGFEKPFDPDGQTYLADALERLAYHTGVNASAAVARALETGGEEAVREAIGRLRTDSARRAYYHELIRQGGLGPAAVVGVVREAAEGLESSSALSGLITTAAPYARADDASTVALIEMTKRIDSDTTQLRALRELLPEQPSPRVAAAMLDAMSTIGSDSSRYPILIDFANNGGLTAETRPAYFALVNGMQSSSYRGRLLREIGADAETPVTVAVLDASRGISSDTERTRVVASTMAGGRVDPGTAPQVLEALGAIRSDSQRASLLQDFVRKGGLTAATAPAFFPLVAGMSSGSYQQRVMNDVSAMDTLPAAVVSGFLDAAASVRGDSDRAQVLMRFIARHPATGADRERYLVAADGIQSETNQNRVLAALVRAERGRR